MVWGKKFVFYNYCVILLLLFTITITLFFSHRFVDKYTELKRHSKLNDSALFEETAKALLAEGIVLRRRGAPVSLAKSLSTK